MDAHCNQQHNLTFLSKKLKMLQSDNHNHIYKETGNRFAGLGEEAGNPKADKAYFKEMPKMPFFWHKNPSPAKSLARGSSSDSTFADFASKFTLSQKSSNSKSYSTIKASPLVMDPSWDLYYLGADAKEYLPIEDLKNEKIITAKTTGQTPHSKKRAIKEARREKDAMNTKADTKDEGKWECMKVVQENNNGTAPKKNASRNSKGQLICGWKNSFAVSICGRCGSARDSKKILSYATSKN
ncbi:hypothetical protein HYFRA_00006470 [Hymenoscyphus fraxineus]|uniref:Uncharacterized protein n=1 Tax=Hymenoscyphus fraxineus TaxID=746836 RepID=A0A9N9KT29_9HELO|nr:hypothetical protein HYFRA_00006470 [Hymenoscyphus fraxineus]